MTWDIFVKVLGEDSRVMDLIKNFPQDMPEHIKVLCAANRYIKKNIYTTTQNISSDEINGFLKIYI